MQQQQIGTEMRAKISGRVLIFTLGLIFLIGLFLIPKVTSSAASDGPSGLNSASAGSVNVAPQQLPDTPTATSTATDTATSTSTSTSTAVSTPSPTSTDTATLTSTSTSTSTSTNTSTSTGTPPTPTTTSSPTVTGTLTVGPNLRISVVPTQALINEIFTFTITVGNTGTGPTRHNTVVDSFSNSFMDVLEVTTTRGTFNKLTHSFQVNIGDINPGEVVTITARVRVNSTLTVSTTQANTALLSCDNCTSITASVNYTALATTLPGTGDPPLNIRAAKVKPTPLITGVLILGLGAILLSLGIWYKLRQKQDRLWMIAMGILLILVGFTVGAGTSGLLQAGTQAVDQIITPTGNGVLAQIYPIQPSETTLPWRPASAYSTPEVVTPFATLPDYPVPTPKMTVTPKPGETGPDISSVVRIAIPALSLDTVVKYVPYDGFTWLINGLRQEVAWMGNTSWPGLGGNTGFAGHVTVTGMGDGPFRHLDKLPAGEMVILYTEKNIYTYQVRESRITNADDFSVISPTDNPQITLITCVDWDPVSYTYLNRFIVFADLMRTEPITMGSVP